MIGAEERFMIAMALLSGGQRTASQWQVARRLLCSVG